jgi:hypothetical protein
MEMKTMIGEIREDTAGIREEKKVSKKGISGSERGEGGAKERICGSERGDEKKNGRRRRQIDGKG